VTYEDPPTGGFDVAVIGGGFAGLAAGTLLADRGVRVLLLEARPRLGGRATAFRDRETGETVDNGQHVLFGCYRETLAFLSRIGANQNVRVQESLEVPFIARTGERSVLRCGRWPPPLHLLAGILTWDAVPLADRLSSLRIALALRRTRLPFRTPETVAAWLRRHRQSEALIETLWEPLAVAALNQSIAEAEAGPFVRVLREMFAGDRSASALVLPTRPLDQMYANPARAFIEARGGLVRTDSLARAILNRDGPTAVDVRTRNADTSAGPERLPVTHVISTVPWHALRNMLPDPPPALRTTIAAATAMKSMPIVTVNLWYDRIVMDEPFVGLSGRTVQWVFDKRQVFGESSSHLSLVVSGAGSVVPLSRDELVAMAVREVAEAIPQARAATLVRATVVREKQATFSLQAGQPPRPAGRTIVPRFFLAGDWTDTGLPGTIESAVLSGHTAARAILEK
jgi:squalene-associated FAD-dependent desaturase